MFKLSRPLSSYAKIQALIARLRRGRQFQLRGPRLAQRRYLDVGCGPNVHPEFINLDYIWRPGIDVCWDISRGLPFEASRFDGVYSEHCLEHFSLPHVETLLGEFRRVLKPGGLLRLVVPDAGLYLQIYQQRSQGDLSQDFPYPGGHGYRAALLGVNQVFYVDRDSVAGHRCMFDFELLHELLHAAGFSQVRKVAYREGLNPALLIDTANRRPESLYLEAQA